MSDPARNLNVPTVPQPSTSADNLAACVMALKAGVESLGGMRGKPSDRAVTFNDLIDFGVLTHAAVQSPNGSFVQDAGVTSITAGMGLTGGTIATSGTIALDIPVSVAHGGTGATTVAGSPFLPLTGGVLAAPGNLTVNGTTSLAAATATTPPTPDNNTKVATTAFVKAQGYTSNLGTVTSITAGTGLTGGTITGTGTIALSVPVSVANGGTGATTVAGSPFLPLTGGTLTGALTLASGVSLYLGGVTSGNGPKFFGDTTNVAWTLGTGNGNFIWYNNSNTQVMGLNSAGALNVAGNAVVNGWFSTGLNTPAYPAGTGAFAISWNFTGGSGEVDFWNTYTSGAGFNSFHWRQQTGASAATLLMQLGPSGLQLGTTFLKTGGGPSYRMSPNANNTGIGSFWYTDTGNMYLLLTANNDAWGSYNGLRPFMVDLASGVVTMGHGLSVTAGGITTVSGGVTVGQGGDLLLSRTDNAAGWILRPATAGLKNLNMATSGAGTLDTINMYSVQTNFSGTVTAANGITSNGANAAFFFADRAGTAPTTWGFYANGGTARLWNSSNSDVVTFGADGTIYPGNIILRNQYALYGKDTGGTARTLIWIDASNSLNICDQARAIVMGGPIYPTQANVWQCGTASNYWYQIFTGGGGYQTGSDRRMKTDIEDLPDCLDLVRGIAPQRFRWRDGPDTKRTHWGFIAQDVGEVMGEDFGGYSPADPDNPKSIAGLNYNQLVAVLWKACQELAARVETLEART